MYLNDGIAPFLLSKSGAISYSVSLARLAHQQAGRDAYIPMMWSHI